MKRAFPIALLLLAAHAAQAREPEPAGQAALARDLVALETERQAAYVSGDRTVLERQFAAEYVHVNLRGGRTNRAGELGFYAPGVFSLKDGTIGEVEVRDYGDTAVLLGLVDWKDAAYRPAPGTVIDLSGKFRVTRVYVWRDGRWQLSASHASKVG